MFPGPNARIYYNEAGEPLGWDYPEMDDAYDPDAFLPGDEEDYPEGIAPPRQDTWPDLDGRCEDLIKEAFSVLNEAPGQRQTYARVQQKLAEAIRILRGTE